jgi:hypothetical protein
MRCPLVRVLQVVRRGVERVPKNMRPAEEGVPERRRQAWGKSDHPLAATSGPPRQPLPMACTKVQLPLGGVASTDSSEVRPPRLRWLALGLVVVAVLWLVLLRN